MRTTSKLGFTIEAAADGAREDGAGEDGAGAEGAIIAIEGTGDEEAAPCCNGVDKFAPGRGAAVMGGVFVVSGDPEGLLGVALAGAAGLSTAGGGDSVADESRQAATAMEQTAIIPAATARSTGFVS